MYKTTPSLIILLLISSSLYAQSKDVAGSKDHPLFTRVPGSTIIQYDFKKFDQAVLPLSKYLTLSGEFTKKKQVTGAVYRIGYKIPAGRSTFAILNSYKEALNKGDAEILFECSESDGCGNAFDTGLNKQPGEDALFGMVVVEEESQHYLAARLDKPAGDIYVMVYTFYQYDTEDPYLKLRVIETETEQEQLVTLNARTMKKALDKSGHIAVEGIYFDTGKATIRPESAPVLKEMAKVLNKNHDLEVYIVGHTDDTGPFAANMELSKLRAKAVADYLIQNLDVPAGQVDAYGVGPLAPAATNSTAEGRQKNRRVEIVKQLLFKDG